MMGLAPVLQNRRRGPTHGSDQTAALPLRPPGARDLRGGPVGPERAPDPGPADTAAARLACVYSGAEREVAADALLLVTARTPRDELYQALVEDVAGGRIAGLHRVGDCHAPGAIVHAVYSGHRLARELGEANPVPALRERP